MTASDFSKLVRGARRGSGKQWTGFCPAHDDRENRSLSWADGDKGLVLQCFAGCDTKDVLAKLGLTFKDVFPEKHTKRPHRTPLTVQALAEAKGLPAEFLRSAGVEQDGDAVKITYREMDGTPAHRHRIRTAVKAAKGSYWSKGPGGILPYGLWKLSEARTNGNLIIPEGESDWWTAAYHGVPALGIPSATMTKVLQAEHLAGIDRLYIVNEQEDGAKKFLPSMARRLAAIGWRGEVKVITMPDGLKDLNDLHRDNPQRFRERLEQALQSATSLTPASGDPDTDDASEASVTDESGLVIVNLADVEAEDVDWMWPGRIAAKKLTLLTGDPGLGKSFITDDVAARLSTGSPWPDGGCAPMGNIIVLSAEDGLADTIRPRIDRLGGNPSRVFVVEAVREHKRERGFSLAADLPKLEQAITATDAKLVIIDPLSAYLGNKADSFKDADVRGLLAPLSALAERTGVAVIAIMHLTKDPSKPAIHRASGSIAFTAAARVVLAVGKDPDDETGARRFLMHVKNNLSAPPPALAYRINAEGLKWEPKPVDGIDVDVVLSRGAVEPDKQLKLSMAKEFLLEILKNGEVGATEIFDTAKRNGIARRTLYRAKAALGVKGRHQGKPGDEDSAWYWYIPPESKGAKTPGDTDDWQPSERREAKSSGSSGTSPKAATSREMATFDDAGGNVPDPPKVATSSNVATFDEPYVKKEEFPFTAPKGANVDPPQGHGNVQPPAADQVRLTRIEWA